MGLLKILPQTTLFDTYLSQADPYCYGGSCSFRGITDDAESMIYASFYTGLAKIDPTRKKVITVKSMYPPFGVNCR